MDNKPMFIYGIKNRETGKLVNRKSNSSNLFFARKNFAEQKVIQGKEEVITFQLVEINT